jgi:hypothetical protein
MVTPAPGTPLESITVVLEPTHTRAALQPAPAGGSATAAADESRSRFAVAQVFQSLVVVTCDGRVVPELAHSWSSNPAGTEWRFMLRGDALPSSGLALNSDDVQASWSSMLRIPGVVASGKFPPFRSLSMAGTSELAVVLADAQPQSPLLFGNLSLVVTAGSGSGAYQMVAPQSATGAELLRPRVPGAGPTIVVREFAGADARDLLDRGADILQTRNPIVLDYASTGPFTIHPLPFDRTYALVIPEQSRSSDNTSRPDREEDEKLFRSEMARSGVRGEARPAVALSWWPQLRNCVELGDTERAAAGSGAAQPPTSQPRVVYEQGDAVAQSIAERIVALARSGAADAGGRKTSVLADLSPLFSDSRLPQLTAVGVDAETIRSGEAAAYILRLPTRTTAPCMQLRQFRHAAPWVTTAFVFPLVESRSFRVVRAGAPALRVDWDGTLRVVTRVHLPQSGRR